MYLSIFLSGTKFIQNSKISFKVNLIITQYNGIYSQRTEKIMASTMSKTTPEIISGNVHSFVYHWLKILLANRHVRGSYYKDWDILQNLTIEELSKRDESNIISFNVNRKTHPPTKFNQYVYRSVTNLVKTHCIDSDLSLPGFYAFLRKILDVQKQYQASFKEDQQLTNGCNTLIAGYWNEVKPSLHDVAYGQSENMSADRQALAGIDQAMQQQEPHSEYSNDLDPKLPFQAMKTIKADLQQVLGSKPTATPTPTMGG